LLLDQTDGTSPRMVLIWNTDVVEIAFPRTCRTQHELDLVLADVGDKPDLINRISGDTFQCRCDGSPPGKRIW
jgi:hypothetical protein